jgi:hypothetical protein
MKRLNYLNSKEDIFYKIIYPLFAREFLFGTNYEVFAKSVSNHFILNNEQWEYILEHWELKEYLL